MAQLGDIAGLLDPLIQKAAGLTSVFVPLGKQFLALALVITCCLALYEWWLGSVSGAVTRVVRGLLTLIVPLALLFNWGSWMQTTSKFFSHELTAPVLSAAGMDSGGEVVKNVINKLTSSMFPANKKPDAAGEKSLWDTARDFVSGEVSIGQSISGALLQALFDAVLMLVAFFVSIALILALYGPLLALQIGIVLGPLLVAWLPFAPLSHLTRSWFQFMLSNGFALVVGVIFAVLAAEVVVGYAGQMSSVGAAGIPWFEELLVRLGGFISSTAVVLFIAFFLFRADDIASALLGGGSAGGGGAAMLAAGALARAARGVRAPTPRVAVKPGGAAPPPPPPPPPPQ